MAGCTSDTAFLVGVKVVEARASVCVGVAVLTQAILGAVRGVRDDSVTQAREGDREEFDITLLSIVVYFIPLLRNGVYLYHKLVVGALLLGGASVAIVC